MTATCPRCLCRLDLHTDGECVAAVVEAARPFVNAYREIPNAARNDVDVLVRVSWGEWDNLRRIVERSEREG